MSTRQPTAEHLALMNSLKAALGEHPNCTAEDMLAVASQLVGNLTALQDQTKYTSMQVMDLVAKNVQIGNRTAIKAIFAGTGAVRH